MKTHGELPAPRPAKRAPEAMLDLDIHVRAADLMLEGLRMEYLTAMTTGRLDKWAVMAHSIIEVLADGPKIHKRAEIVDVAQQEVRNGNS